MTALDLWQTTKHHYPCHAIDEFRTQHFPDVHELTWSELGELNPDDSGYHCQFRLSSGRTYVITGCSYNWSINLCPADQQPDGLAPMGAKSDTESTAPAADPVSNLADLPTA